MDRETFHARWGVRPFERHSLVLYVAGTVYILIGISYLFADPPPSRTASLYYALRILSYQHWGYVFMFVGLLAVLSSRWPKFSETWGYQALTGQSAAWAMFYLMGILFGKAEVANVSGVFSWGMIAFLWWAISGLVNPKAFLSLEVQMRSVMHENIELHKELLRQQEREG